jgi:hypothetical protein
MKHLHTLIVFLLTASLYAQTTDTVFEHGEIYGNSMAIRGDELYFSGDTHIFKIDHTQTNPSAVEVLEVSATDLLFRGDELYYISGSNISKIDVTAQSPSVVGVTSAVENPTYMAFKGDDLYVSSVTFENGIEATDLFIIDVTDSEATATHVFDGPEAILRGLAFYGNGNELYFISSNGFDNHSILKIDVSQPSPTSTEVISSLASDPRSLTFDGNDLYISFLERVSKIDVSGDLSSIVDVISIQSHDVDKILVEGEHLYIASNDSDNEIGRITRYTDSTLDFGGIDAQTPALYPNPAKEELYLLGADIPQPFRIYNLLGTEIARGSVSENAPIDIRTFTKGLYFVRLENGQTLKFVKN